MNTLTCPDRGLLLSLALGDPDTPDLELHVLECASCRAEVERVRKEIGVLRSHSSVEHTTAPARDTASALLRADGGEETPPIIGKYWIVGELGRGGQARVLRGIHISMDRDVAIKWSKQPLPPSGTGQNALVQEAKLLAELEHPGIVRVFDLDFHEGRPYLVMQYVRGRDLDQYTQGKPMPARAAARLVAQVARAAAAAHARGVTHQDIKPGNILIDEAGRPRLGDFGIARLQDAWNSGADGQGSGGTLAYMAPEQADRGARQVGPACDIFGLGGVLFQLVTGKPPRSPSADFASARRQAADGVIDWAALDDATAPGRLRAILRKALAADPKDRYAHAEELADDLERFADAPEVWRRRTGWLAACATLLLIGGGIFAVANRPGAVVPTLRTPLTLRIQRDGTQRILKTQDDLDKLDSLREGDKIGVAGNFPPGIHIGLFGLTFDPSGKIDVHDLGPLEIADQHYVTSKVFPLEHSPATEIIVACGAKSQTPTAAEVAECVGQMRDPKPADRLLLRTVHIRFDADKVDSVRGLGKGEQDSVGAAVHVLDQMRGLLRQKFAFIDGLAFSHFPAEQKIARLVQGAGAQPAKKAVIDPEDEKLLADVMERLLATEMARAQYPQKYAWPPHFKVIVPPGRPQEINAFSFAAPDPNAGKRRPVIFVTQALITKVAQGRNREARLARLAAVTAHEMGHVFLDHIASAVNLEKVETLAIGRSEELDADMFGKRLTAAAGFSQAECLRAAEELQKQLGGRSDFHALKETHPSWEQRLARLDKDREKYWKSMAGFNNGVFFLDAERYEEAVACFSHVLDDLRETRQKELEDCKEAWANLGYAKLMMYCDDQTLGDLRKQGIGQIALGAFYARPGQPPRGGDKKKWEEAVADLQKAAEDPNLLLPRANLAIAFLVHYDGKPQVAQAARYFDEAVKLAKKDKGLDDLNLIPILINWGVLDLAQGKKDDAAKKFARSRELVRSLKAPHPFDLEIPLDYNEALLFSSDNDPAQKRRAFGLWESYLRYASPSSSWWKLGVEKYQKLGQELGLKVQTEPQLAQRIGGELMRVVPSVQLDGGILVKLSDDTPETLKRLKANEARATPAYPRSKLKRYTNVRPDVDLLGSEEILAIFLTGEKAPPVQIQGKGLGADKATLRVGMDVRDLPQNLLRLAQPRTLDNSNRPYIYLPGLGLGVQSDGRRVTALVITQAPRQLPKAVFK